MKAMVLAAGLGRRLRPLTLRWAKPTLPVLGRPIIEYAVAALERAGVREVVVNLHHRPETVRRALAEVSGRGLRIRYSEEPEILGTGGGLKRAESFLGPESFFLVNGDTLFDFDLAALAERHLEREAQATLLLRPKPPGSDYTAIGLGEGGALTGVGHGASPCFGFMFAGVWVLEPAVLGRLPHGRFSRLEVELLPALVREGSAFGCVTDAAWFDIGTPRKYLETCLSVAREGIQRELWKAEAARPPRGSSADVVVVAGPGTEIDSSARFEGDAVLGAGCRVAGSATLGGVVLGDGVEVGEGATLRRSVAAAGVRLAPASRVVDKVVMSANSDDKVLRVGEERQAHVVAPIDD